MSKYHFLNTPLPGQHKDSYGIYSREPAGIAIVFVHGFKGHPLTTWGDFPSLVAARAEFKNCDLFFYGYDSLYTQPYVSGTELVGFLTLLLKNPLSLIADFVKRTSGRSRGNLKYKKIVLVAHSLGAVVARIALIEAKKVKSDLTAITSMVLFAPAHSGARIQKIGFELLTGPLKLIGALARYGAVTIDELQPDSPTLKSLKEQTEELIKKGEGDFTVARSVVWAERDKIVHNIPFCGDPMADPARGQTHVTVCKPNARYDLPVRKVLAAVR